MFNQFWHLYPKRNGVKVGKALCLKMFEKFSAEDQALCLKATERYAKAVTPKGSDFVPLPRDPIRFLKHDWWRDWVPVEKPQQPRLPVAPAPKPEFVSMHEALKDAPEQLATLERMLSHGPTLSLAFERHEPRRGTSV